MKASSGLKAFFAVATVLAVIAGVMLFVGSNDTDRFFAWTIDPPLTAAFMGAAYWAAVVLLGWASRQRDWARARTALPAVFLIALLLLVASLIHLDRFDLDSLFGWFWLVVYALVVPLLAVLTWRAQRVAQPVPPARRHLPEWLRWALALQAIVLAGFGVALFVAPEWAAPAWPWVLSPLTARAIAAFLIGFAAAAAFAMHDNDLERLTGSAYSYATLGALELLAAAIHSSDLTASTLGCSLYFLFWASVLGVGGYGVLASASSARSAAA